MNIIYYKIGSDAMNTRATHCLIHDSDNNTKALEYLSIRYFFIVM